MFAAVLALPAAVAGACLGLAAGILLRPALELVRKLQGRPAVPYTGGWVGLFAGASLLLGVAGAVLGAIGGIVLFFHGVGGNAGSITFNGSDDVLGELLALSCWLVGGGVAILLGATLVRYLLLLSGFWRADRVESSTEGREGAST